MIPARVQAEKRERENVCLRQQIRVADGERREGIAAALAAQPNRSVPSEAPASTMRSVASMPSESLRVTWFARAMTGAAALATRQKFTVASIPGAVIQLRLGLVGRQRLPPRSWADASRAPAGCKRASISLAC